MAHWNFEHSGFGLTRVVHSTSVGLVNEQSDVLLVVSEIFNLGDVPRQQDPSRRRGPLHFQPKLRVRGDRVQILGRAHSGVPRSFERWLKWTSEWIANANLSLPLYVLWMRVLLSSIQHFVFRPGASKHSPLNVFLRSFAFLRLLLAKAQIWLDIHDDLEITQLG